MPRVGLVLGAGGVLGGAWLVGALHAIATETGWDPGGAEYLVGTSAGAMIAGLMASGVPPWFMFAHSAGQTGQPDDDAAEERRDGAAEGARDGEQPAEPARRRDPERDTRTGGAVYRLHPGIPSLGPGSWRLALASLARPYRYSPAAMLAGWLPQGLISSQPLKDTIARVAADGWPPHPNLWIMACDYATGRRVAFGAPDAPSASLADAVAASCAIPGFYRPVEIGGRRYVDGGVGSTSNLDIIAGCDLDLVICLNPTSSLHAPSPGTLGERGAAMLRQASGRRLGHEAKRVQARGSEVVLIQPTVHDLDAMGSNLMSGRRRNRVIRVAAETVGKRLHEPELRSRLRGLPKGEPMLVRRPGAPLTERPDFEGLARARWVSAAGAGRREHGPSSSQRAS